MVSSSVKVIKIEVLPGEEREKKITLKEVKTGVPRDAGQENGNK